MSRFQRAFNNVAECSQAESFLHHVSRRFLTEEEYFGFRGKFVTDSAWQARVLKERHANSPLQP
jgi:hypothetical protein